MSALETCEPMVELVERLDNLISRSYLGLTGEEAALIRDAERLLERLRRLEQRPDRKSGVDPKLRLCGQL